MSDFLQKSAQDYLELQFSEGVGHTLLAQAAASLFDGFKTAFRFGPGDVRAAEAHASNNTSAQVQHLLSRWYMKAPTNQDLKDALLRWNHKVMLRQLGFVGDDVGKEVIGTRAAPPSENLIAPPSDKDSILERIEKMQEMLTFFQTNVALLNQELTSLKRDYKGNLIKK